MDAAKLKAKLRTEIDNVARHKKLQGYEIPREFIIEPRPFSKDNHLITDSNKMARGQLKKRCGSMTPDCNTSAAGSHFCTSMLGTGLSVCMCASRTLMCCAAWTCMYTSPQYISGILMYVRNLLPL
jgi:hypothetical protein